MSFYLKRTVKNPKKDYKCYICHKPIVGEHFYISAKKYDFYTYRCHCDCYEKVDAMCSKCDDCYDCEGDVAECFYEKVERKENKQL